MEAVLTNILNVVPGWLALVLMLGGFAFYVLGAIRLGYKQYVKQWALELVTIAEDSIMGSGQGAKKKAQVFAALRGALPDWMKPFITDEVLDSVIEKAVSMMKKALSEKSPRSESNEDIMAVPMCGIIAASANSMNQARKREKVCNLKGDNREFCKDCLLDKYGECIEKRADKE